MSVAFDYVTARAERQWDFTHSHRPFALLLRCLGATKAVIGVWICQHADGDWQRAHCKGPPERVWRYDASGLTQVDGLPELDKSGIASTTPVISFCLDATTERMIYQEWNGVRSGYGTVLALNREEGRWYSERTGWRS